MKKRKEITQKVRSKYWQRRHKLGINIPNSVLEALNIDKQKGNHIWIYSINKDMLMIKNSVDEYDGNTSNLIGYQKITGHTIFDVKRSKNLCRKDRFVTNGHKTETPNSITYITAVSMYYVIICLTISASNNIHVLADNVNNAYLLSSFCEKVWMRVRP